jgi:pimeloyl-ACP methyl ester carboxylesterase
MTIDVPGPTSHSYFSQRLRLHYVDWGNQDAPPLLLVHGGRDHCRNWDWVAETLREDWHIIAPDLRGHGDSQWMIGGSYGLSDYVYDIAQLLHQTKHQPITIIGHSLGGSISLQYTAIYPETVRKLVAIEGLGWPPSDVKERESKPPADRVTEWIDFTRGISGRVPRRYPTIEEAFQRMQAANPHLTYSWKYDNYTRIRSPFGFPESERQKLWERITCPTLLVRGTESWATDPSDDGRAKHFQSAEIANIEGAGHWVHHDRLDEFVRLVKGFLAD